MKPKTIKTQEGAGSTNVWCIDRFHNLRGSTVVIATSCIFLLYSQLVWHLAAPIYVKSSLCSESLLLTMMKHFIADKRQKNLTILESAPVANSTRLLNPKQNQNEWREWKFDIQQQIISCPWPSFTDHLLSCLAVDFSLYMLQIDPQHKAVNRFRPPCTMVTPSAAWGISESQTSKSAPRIHWRPGYCKAYNLPSHEWTSS